jgi:hypothetical protein
MSTVRGLRESIQGVRESSFMASDELYVSWNRNVAALIQTVDHFNAEPTMETTSVYESLNGMAEEWRKTLADFREHPQKYLRLKMF